MKVLFLTNIPSPYRVDFFNELGKYCELTVLYEREKADDRDWSSDKNINYQAIYLKGIKKGNDTALCFSVIKYLIKQYNYIIIGGYSTPTGMLAIEFLRMLRKKYVLNCDGGFIRFNEKKINYNIKKHFISNAKFYLSTGKTCSEYLEYYGAKKENIYVYPFTSLYKNEIIDNILTENEKNKLKEELNISNNKNVICVSQMIHRKGIDILLKAASLVSEDINFYIIGGEPTSEYTDLIKELNLKNIKFIKFMNKDKLYKYYQATNLFVLPTREDIWGLVINEAMANGLPIITTKNCVAGIELVKENGYIIESEDYKDLAKKIDTILASEDILNKFSKVSLKNISDYNIENMAKIIYSILYGEDNKI